MGTKPSRRLVVVSIDGLSLREAEAIAGLPRFSSLMARGAFSSSLRSVFPSLTYVVHATMMTGRHPVAHGVTHNHPLQPGLPADRQAWFWYADQLRVPSLFDLARKAGMRTAAVLWPLVSGARITWNLPEIAALPGENQTIKALRAGSPAYLLALEARFGKFRRGAEQPFLDDFVSRSAAHTIRSRRPDLLMTHLIALDAAKHEAGSDSPAARSALEFLDLALGRIIDALGDSGLADSTDLVVLGDHGHIDIHHRIRPNRLLQDAGLCGHRDGAFGWRAWCRCSGGSAFVHTRPGDAGAEALVRSALEAAAADPAMGIEAILDRGGIAALHGDGDASFALLARPGFQFLEEFGGPLAETESRPGAFGADHGYSPELPGYRSLLLAAGPGIRSGRLAGEIEMVDVAPSLARLMGLEFPAGDGAPIEGLFQD
ncbi:MAG TPA: ectonucleotide pyrophosphatase/phosphodiesterase [Rectinemataceae bacterium]|nr:ectonucleotide pyrophosphatase/phosphodiesterase [Rectinemataceae bacterium]